MNERANQLARFLQRQGVAPETRVGICLERSPQLLVAVLGVLKAGGTYVPLDPAYTRDAEERLKYVLQDAQVALVLTSSALAASLGSAAAPLLVLDAGTMYPWSAAESIGAESPSNLDAATGHPCIHGSSENLAYILYTSGSTGRPKGVMVTHRNLVNAYYGWQNAYRLETEVRSHLQMASFGFDVFGGDMVRALCSGGKLVICPKETLLDPARLLRLIRRENVDIGEFVPVVMRHLVQYLEDTDQRLDSLRLVIVGSDAWYVAEHKRALRLLGSNSRLINSYGLTETTIDSSYFEGDAGTLPDAALVPIGRPFANVRLYVLDCADAARAGRSARRAVHRRRRRLARVRPSRSQRRAVSRRSVRAPIQDPFVPDRGPCALACRRAGGVSGPRGQPGQDPRVPRRAGRDRGGPGRAS